MKHINKLSHKLAVAKPLKTFKAEVQIFQRTELSKVTNLGRQSGTESGTGTNTFSKGNLCVEKLKDLLNGNQTNPDYSDNTYYQPFSTVQSLPFTQKQLRWILHIFIFMYLIQLFACVLEEWRFITWQGRGIRLYCLTSQ